MKFYQVTGVGRGSNSETTNLCRADREEGTNDILFLYFITVAELWSFYHMLVVFLWQHCGAVWTQVVVAVNDSNIKVKRRWCFIFIYPVSGDRVKGSVLNFRRKQQPNLHFHTRPSAIAGFNRVIGSKRIWGYDTTHENSRGKLTGTNGFVLLLGIF